jgi:translation initiation factor 2 subunit 2
MADPTAATTEEPLFDPSLKKRKKKKVIFDEDPLGADGAEEPETPAAPAAAETAPGPSILKPAEASANNDNAAPVEDKQTDEDFNAMFGDLKKKKKKKEIPLDLDLVCQFGVLECARCPAVIDVWWVWVEIF